MSRIPLLAVFLWIEAGLLVALAIWSGPLWLLPAAGLLVLIASLMTHRSAWFGIFFALAASAAWIFSIKPEIFPTLPTAYPVITLIAGVACAFFGILASLGKIPPSPISTALGRMVVALHFLAAGAFLAAGFSPVPLPRAFAWACCGLIAIFAVDTFSKLVSRLYTPLRHWDGLAAPGAFFFFRWLGKDGQACFPAARASDDAFALKLPEMWMWPALRGRLPALAIAALAVTWLGSSLHEISANQSGVRQTAGTWEEKPLAPGFHLSLPWPLGVIHRVDTERIYETVLGFRADPGQPILWERAHYEDEEMSLVGGGDDLLSISVPIHFRIADPAAYLRGAADPQRLVRDAGSRILLDLTLRRSAAEVMTYGREEIRADFLGKLQAELDRDRSGIQVAKVYLRDIHPPVQVATSFQEVLAAMEEKETMLHDAESYHRDYGTRARSDATQLIVKAESAAANRLARASGEMMRFNLRRDAWNLSRPLFELREGFQIFDEAMADSKKAIFDDRIRSSMTTQLDLRKVLNPDLIDNAPSTPESLIPRPSKSREAFDLDIEGFLRTDQGEVPAVNAGPDDPDNLLKTNVPDK
jgi:regulator of protease activity HflC (stomatin/prohibitin superfamily)